MIGAAERSALMREEIFGPLAAVAHVPDFEAAIEAANDTEFGLSAAIFTRDLGRAMAFAREIEAGQVHINRETAGRRAARAVRRAQGLEQHAARAGQGGEAVLHQHEDRLRPRPLTARQPALDSHMPVAASARARAAPASASRVARDARRRAGLARLAELG